MRAVLVDDEKLALDYLEHHLNQIGNIEIIGKYLDPFKAKQTILTEAVDVVFLDINLPEITGLELAEQLLERNPRLLVVFITAYDEHAVEAFELNALDYVVKPVRMDRLRNTMKRIKNQMREQMREVRVTARPLSVQVGQQLLIEGFTGKLEKVFWRTSRAQELFLYLLLNKGKHIRKSFLVEEFWPDFEAERAYSQLYSTIYLVRKRLVDYEGHFEIKNTRESYQLIAEDVAIDLVEWEEQLTGAPLLSAATIEQHEQIMNLYTGSFLVDYGYTWAEAERYRLEALWIKHSLAIGDWYYQHDYLDEANEIYQAIIRAYPEVEPAWFSQIKIHAALGNEMMVFQLYDQLVQVLENEVDLPPSSEVATWFQTWQETLSLN